MTLRLTIGIDPGLTGAVAVLGDGESPIVVRQGQRVGLGAYRVRRIGQDQVELAGAGPAGQVLRLTLQKEKP